MRGWTSRWSPRSPRADGHAGVQHAFTAPGGVAPRPSAPRAGSTHPLVQRVLAARGLIEPDRCAAFLDPRMRQLHDPSLMSDMDAAAARLLNALEAGEPIVIYGDYDVDGITATAILYRTLRTLRPGADIRTYVPHRLEEGYGLNCEAIESLAAEGARVIVSVDCGVTAIEPALVARRAGVDLIITDHHNPPQHSHDLPAALAVVHPRHPAATYPFGDLSGAGVAYKLAWRLATMHARGPTAAPHMRDLLIDLLALASLGTIADIVPLVGENRVIARYGLSRIKHSPIIGLRALVEASGLAGENVDATSVGFKLGPRLNASGRLGHARAAVELFITEDHERAVEIAKGLSRLNDERRQVELAIFNHACELAQRAGMHEPDRRAIVLAHPDWHAGVVGIVCSRLVQRFCRPAILMHVEDGVCHGSARSVDGFNLHGALTRCEHLLDRYGGHDMAAGLHLKEANLPAFVEAFTREANDGISQDQLTPCIEFDCEADAAELTPDIVRQLDGLAPFGRHNPEVRVLVRGLTVAAQPQTMGAQARHLALRLRKGDQFLRAIGWGFGEHAPRLAEGSRIDAVVEPKINTFNGRVSVEPILCDLCTTSN